MLTFNALRAANLARLPLFKNAQGEVAHSMPDGSDWSIGEWVMAFVGELGEACNIMKKMKRGDFSSAEIHKAQTALEHEFADAQTYLDLLAYRAGVDLGAATMQKFNMVSRRVGCSVMLNPPIPIAWINPEGNVLTVQPTLNRDRWTALYAL